jgi:hypothetical protein
MVQARLKNFLRFCFDSKWLERVPRLSPLKADEVPTLPLSAKEPYGKVLVKRVAPVAKTAAAVLRFQSADFPGGAGAGQNLGDEFHNRHRCSEIYTNANG